MGNTYTLDQAATAFNQSLAAAKALPDANWPSLLYGTLPKEWASLPNLVAM